MKLALGQKLSEPFCPSVALNCSRIRPVWHTALLQPEQDLRREGRSGQLRGFSRRLNVLNCPHHRLGEVFCPAPATEIVEGQDGKQNYENAPQ